VVEEWVRRNLLRRFRGEAGLSVRRAADALGVTYATVSQWERGRKVPRPANFARLAELTGLSIEGLAGEWHRWLQERPRPAVGVELVAKFEMEENQP
jgi:transcriptional regulator with XRE-family HTH domain